MNKVRRSFAPGVDIYLSKTKARLLDIFMALLGLALLPIFIDSLGVYLGIFVWAGLFSIGFVIGKLYNESKI